MYRDQSNLSVLIVSASGNAETYLREVLRSGNYMPVCAAKSLAEAGRMHSENPFDLVIVNTPLPDGFGTDFAVELCENSSVGVLLFVKSELFEQVNYQVEQAGVLTFVKPGNRQTISQAICLMAATHNRLAAFERRAVTLETKMKEIRLVNRAKWLLIERFQMSEEEAHKYIEKTAMDSCIRRGQVAENIIQTYEN